MIVTLVVVAGLALLLAATAAPAIRSGRRAEEGVVPLVAPRGSGFGDATALVAACPPEPVRTAASSARRPHAGPRVRLAWFHAHA